jgi:hypothetical protein
MADENTERRNYYYGQLHRSFLFELKDFVTVAFARIEFDDNFVFFRLPARACYQL